MKKKEISIAGKKIPCRFIRRKGMRKIILSIRSDGSVLVSAPRYAPFFFVNSFVERSKEWIEREYKKRFSQETAREQKDDREEYNEKKEEARKIIEKKVEKYAEKIGVTHSKISIRNQKTRWGSCSRNGNLSFSYKIAFFSEEILEYVVIHELCHRVHFDHSQRFWSLVEEFCPKYQKIRRSLQMMKKI